MKTMIERFRNWYDHERHCNARILAMLNSVPEDRRQASEFQRAIDLMSHMIAARRMWLHRLGQWPASPQGWSMDGTSLDELPQLISETEKAWVTFLLGINDADLSREQVWKGFDGRMRRWPVELILTQVSGHAWYHRGQIVVLVGQLGGKTESTDYIFWNQPTVIPDTAS